MNEIRNKTLTRRGFIKITAMVGGVILGGEYLLDLTGNRLVTVKDSRVLMGTIINLTVLATTREAGENAVGCTFKRLEQQIAIFDHRSSRGLVGQLNQTGKLRQPPTELIQVIKQAIAVSGMTGGAFDITIKPLVDLYQQAYQAKVRLPDQTKINQACSLIDYTKITVSSELIKFTKPGMAITLDGIAKGFIVDQGVAVLKDLGFQNVMVEAGGDLMAGGLKDGAIPWRIGIKPPREGQSDLVGAVEVENQAVATSGDYQNFFSPDMSHHHIIDPRTGNSNSQLASATVIAPTCMQADALATSLMVLNIQQGLNLIESLDGVETYLISKDMKGFSSQGFLASHSTLQVSI